jgi:hypothetical protein
MIVGKEQNVQTAKLMKRTKKKIKKKTMTTTTTMMMMTIKIRKR